MDRLRTLTGDLDRVSSELRDRDRITAEGTRATSEMSQRMIIMSQDYERIKIELDQTLKKGISIRADHSEVEK